MFPSYNAIANPPEAAVGGLLEIREGQRYDSAHQPEATVRNVEVDSRMNEAGFRNTRAHTQEPVFLYCGRKWNYKIIIIINDSYFLICLVITSNSTFLINPRKEKLKKSLTHAAFKESNSYKSVCEKERESCHSPSFPVSRSVYAVCGGVYTTCAQCG